MGSIERKLRQKEEVRCQILQAAWQIVTEEGWQSLSMRKIADRIEYTSPIIYSHFENKEALLVEFTRKGFIELCRMIKAAYNEHTGNPTAQLEAMWMAYWNFAFAEKELYQVMYGVEANCCVMGNACDDVKAPSNMLWNKIEEIVPLDKRTDDYIDTKYYTFWSVVHGLISINLTRQQTSEDINKQVLKDAIGGIINSITN